MPDARRRVGLALTAVLALAVSVPGLIAVVKSAKTIRADGLADVVLLLVCAVAVLARERWPLLMAAVVSVSYVVAVQSGTLDPALNSMDVDLVGLGVIMATVILSYSLGRTRPWLVSGFGVVLLVLAEQWGSPSPFPAMIAFGPWLIGRLLNARQEMAATLIARGAELEAERERYAAEAVRYERTRVARELHDVVAHSMSVVVIQAAAGQRLAADDSVARARVLATIADLVRQAEADVGALTRLLDQDSQSAGRLSRQVVEQFLFQADRTGAKIDVSLAGDLDTVGWAASSALYRVLQEGLTNAFKYAPGAAIKVSLAVDERECRVEVSNERAALPASGLEDHGGGHGLTGLADRVSDLGGQLVATPTSGGGWRLSAALPCAAVRLAG